MSKQVPDFLLKKIFKTTKRQYHEVVSYKEEDFFHTVVLATKDRSKYLLVKYFEPNDKIRRLSIDADTLEDITKGML